MLTFIQTVRVHRTKSRDQTEVQIEKIVATLEFDELVEFNRNTDLHPDRNYYVRYEWFTKVQNLFTPGPRGKLISGAKHIIRQLAEHQLWLPQEEQ